MEFISKDSITVLKSDFQDSYQLLWNENSKSENVTITKVFVYPGKTNFRHIHKHSEQIWIALSGSAVLLLDGNQTKEIKEGDVVRFLPGEMHGVSNEQTEKFVYISVTSPPVNFRYAYQK